MSPVQAQHRHLWRVSHVKRCRCRGAAGAEVWIVFANCNALYVDYLAFHQLLRSLETCWQLQGLERQAAPPLQDKAFLPAQSCSICTY